MNSTTFMIAGVILVILGVVGIYHIREAPGLAFFASMGLLGGIAMIAKSRKKI